MERVDFDDKACVTSNDLFEGSLPCLWRGKLKWYSSYHYFLIAMLARDATNSMVVRPLSLFRSSIFLLQIFFFLSLLPFFSFILFMRRV